jgi:hypothetical protein
MPKRLKSLLVAAAGAVAVTAALLAPVGASGATSLPTLNIALNGEHGISVSGSTVSGAVNVVSTFTGKPGPNGPGGEAGLFRLNDGVTAQQVLSAAQKNGDPNAVSQYGSIVFDAMAPSSTQVVLRPGNYIALNLTGQGPGGFTQFTVTQSSSPATLPAARATQTAIEFGFRGPTVLHNGTIVRAQNAGYLVHMIDAVGVPSRAAGLKVMALLRAGKDNKAQRLSNGQFFGLAGPLSTGAAQQAVLHAKPGWYVEVCFMDTQDGREHTRLGMERLIKVVK